MSHESNILLILFYNLFIYMTNKFLDAYENKKKSFSTETLGFLHKVQDNHYHHRLEDVHC